MTSYFAYALKKRVQYTIRGVSPRTDGVLREMAEEQGASLNTIALSLLDAATGGGEAGRFHDLDALAGTWVEDPACDEVLRTFEKVDHGMWR